MASPTDILIKDRYSRVWVYDQNLNLLWSFHKGITGHFPYTIDIDGDGKEEMFIGYASNYRGESHYPKL